MFKAPKYRQPRKKKKALKKMQRGILRDKLFEINFDGIAMDNTYEVTFSQSGLFKFEPFNHARR